MARGHRTTVAPAVAEPGIDTSEHAAGEALPEGIERFSWSGIQWYKVGERLFESLDRAIEALQNEERRAEDAG